MSSRRSRPGWRSSSFIEGCYNPHRRTAAPIRLAVGVGDVLRAAELLAVLLHQRLGHLLAGREAEPEERGLRVGEGRAKRPLSCCVMVLSWSRALHAVFTLDQSLESFLRGRGAARLGWGRTTVVRRMTARIEMPRCPRCGSRDTAPIRRRRGVLERVAWLLLVRPFTCRHCTRRFLAFSFFPRST